MSLLERFARVIAGASMLATFGAWISIRQTGAGYGIFFLSWIVLLGAIITIKASKSTEDNLHN